MMREASAALAFCSVLRAYHVAKLLVASALLGLPAWFRHFYFPPYSFAKLNKLAIPDVPPLLVVSLLFTSVVNALTVSLM